MQLGNKMKTSAVAQKITIPQIVDEYHAAIIELDDAYKQLKTANERIGQFFNYAPWHMLETEHEKRTSDLKLRAWSKVIQISGARRFLSSKKIDELDDKLNTSKYGGSADKMPELTHESAKDLIGALVQNGREFAEDMLREAFDSCRPRSSYKTNKRFYIGNKVILTGVEMTYGGRYRIYYGSYSEKFRVIDRAFYLLDGKQMSKDYENSYNSPLIDAINTSGENCGVGETEYFKFKCYKNGNIHITFKRDDLVTILNQVGNGGRFEVGSGER